MTYRFWFGYGFGVALIAFALMALSIISAVRAGVDAGAELWFPYLLVSMLALWSGQIGKQQAERIEDLERRLAALERPAPGTPDTRITAAR